MTKFQRLMYIVLKQVFDQIAESEDRILKRIVALDTKIERGFGQDKRRDEQMLQLTQDVLAEAQRGTTVGDSVLNLVTQLVANSGLSSEDKTALTDALNAMRGENDKIEAAVLANTPQEVPTE
jgi:hypothetical protein